MTNQEQAKHYMFQSVARIVAGTGSLSSLPVHLRTIGNVKNALLITQSNDVLLQYAEDTSNHLRSIGVSCDLLSGVMQEPTINHIKELSAQIIEDFDVMIGIGGGSVLDTTKILSVLKTNNTSIDDMLGTDRIDNPGIPTVLIPTTAGTGSEVTPNAIVTLPDEELKVGIVSKHLLPELVIIDPSLTLGLPKPITAATGMDAFTHALESYISNKANPISDMYALEAIRKINESIATAYHHGEDIHAREKMMLGSMYGGMALTGAGTAAVHALAYPLGGKFNIPHGVANSMLLPHVMRYNLDVVTVRLAQVAKVMELPNIEAMTKTEKAEQVINQIENWTKDLEIPQNLESFGVKKSDIEELSIAASKVTRLLNNNPKPVAIEDIDLLYRKLLP